MSLILWINNVGHDKLIWNVEFELITEMRFQQIS